MAALIIAGISSAGLSYFLKWKSVETVVVTILFAIFLSVMKIT